MLRALALPLLALALGLGACDGGTDDDTAATTAPATTAPATTQPSEDPEPVVSLDEVAIQLTHVADVSNPTALATRDDDPTLYVTEQEGRVLAVRDAEVTTVVDLAARVSTGFERGLLGLDFSPDGSLLYVHYTDAGGATQVDEYAFDGAGVDPDTRRSILTHDQPFANHNGGQLTVGPDGMLWLGLGDGGGAGDPGDHGQDPTTLLGAILRIDPSAGDPYAIPDDNPFADGGGAPEVWAYGLRNPWRFSFDAETGDLWIGDVGQNAWEEVDLAPAPEAGRGSNFGWPHREGGHDFRGGGPDDLVDPVFEYPNPAEGCSVTGGYVYRGEAIPALRGAYLFTDWCQSTIRGIRVDGGVVVDSAVLPAQSTEVASFGEGPDRELYVLSQGAGLLRIDPA